MLVLCQRAKHKRSWIPGREKTPARNDKNEIDSNFKFIPVRLY